MKRLQFMPYVLVLFSIFLSTLIAFIRHIDFAAFFKRAVVFLLILFFSSKFFVNVIMDIKNEKKGEHKNNKQKNNEQNISSASDQADNDKLEENEFQPLQFEVKRIQNPSKFQQ